MFPIQTSLSLKLHQNQEHVITKDDNANRNNNADQFWHVQLCRNNIINSSRTENNDCFHYTLIWTSFSQLIIWSMKCQENCEEMLITVSQIPRWELQASYVFVWPTPTPKVSVYNEIKQRNAANSQDWEARITESLSFLLEKSQIYNLSILLTNR